MSLRVHRPEVILSVTAKIAAADIEGKSMLLDDFDAQRPLILHIR